MDLPQFVLPALTVIGALATIAGGVVAIVQLRIWLRNASESRIDRFVDIERHGLRLRTTIKRSGFEPAFVLGIGRSGAFLAGWLAGNLGSLRVEVMDRIHSREAGHLPYYPEAAERLEFLKRIHGDSAKVLIVEGASATGRSIAEMRALLKSNAPNWNCRFAVLYDVLAGNSGVDFSAREIKTAPRLFPWHKSDDYFQSTDAKKVR
ncbi:MAG: hypothetical protein JSS00_08105 [Proteobacteria bacterium]|nr:hypothetical protein [Pseudomonadota bacterium]